MLEIRIELKLCGNELILCWITIQIRSIFQGVKGKILIVSLDIAENARLHGMGLADAAILLVAGIYG